MDYIKKQFHGLNTDLGNSERMSATWRRVHVRGPAHGYAGICVVFVALANRMVKKGGTIATGAAHDLVAGYKLAESATAYSRQLLRCDVVPSRQLAKRPFSADTGMAETMIRMPRVLQAPSRRGLFVSLRRRPESEWRRPRSPAIRALVKKVDSTVRTLEDGPFGNGDLRCSCGDERLGEVICSAELRCTHGRPWESLTFP